MCQTKKNEEKKQQRKRSQLLNQKERITLTVQLIKLKFEMIYSQGARKDTILMFSYT